MKKHITVNLQNSTKLPNLIELAQNYGCICVKYTENAKKVFLKFKNSKKAAEFEEAAAASNLIY